jgi:hypothetical protein
VFSDITVQFPPGEILDRDDFVWVTLPPETGISQSRIHGVCSCDPLKLGLAQVTIERGDWRLDLLLPEQPAPFPLAVGFPIAVPGMEPHDVRAWSTAEAPIKITVRVRRSYGARRDDSGRLTALPARRDDSGRLTSLPDPARFHLVLVARGAKEIS